MSLTFLHGCSSWPWENNSRSQVTFSTRKYPRLCWREGRGRGGGWRRWNTLNFRNCFNKVILRILELFLCFSFIRIYSFIILYYIIYLFILFYFLFILFIYLLRFLFIFIFFIYLFYLFNLLNFYPVTHFLVTPLLVTSLLCLVTPLK